MLFGALRLIFPGVVLAFRGLCLFQSGLEGGRGRGGGGVAGYVSRTFIAFGFLGGGGEGGGGERLVTHMCRELSLLSGLGVGG